MEIYDNIGCLLSLMRKRKQERLRYMQYQANKLFHIV